MTGYADLNKPIVSATQGFPNTYQGRRDLLYLNEGGDGDRPTFREVGREAGLEVVGFEYGLGVLLSDLERDGDLDIFIANDTNPDRLYENVPWPGGASADPAGLGFRFEERAARAGVADPGSGMGVAGADYDGDGRSDLFVTNARRQAHGVFRSKPPDENDPSFADARDDLGPDLGRSTGWGVTWGDLDLDTDADLVLVNGKVPVTSLGLGPRAHRRVREPGRAGPARALRRSQRLDARGRRADARHASSAEADYDNDGDLDIAVGTLGGSLVLLENDASSGNWLEVATDGFRPGAEITVELPGGKRLRREIRAGSSYLSSEDPRLTSASAPPERSAGCSYAGPDGQERRGWPASPRTRSSRSSPPEQRSDPAVVVRRVRDRGLHPGRSERPLGGPRLGRSAARRDPTRRARADRPRTEPLPRLGRHVGRLGRVRPRRRRLPRPPRSTRRRTFAPRARRRSALPPIACSSTATRSPAASKRRSQSSPRRCGRSVTGSTTRRRRATRPRRSGTGSPPP